MASTTPPENVSESVSDLCAVASLVETKIEHEIALMGHRMEWLVVSEAFLFGAFATVLAAGNNLDTAPKLIMLFLIPGLGMVLAVLAYISIFAALAVSRSLLNARGAVDTLLIRKTGITELPNLGLTTRNASLRWTEFGGSVTVRFIPPVIFLAWAIILVSVVIMPAYSGTQPTLQSPSSGCFPSAKT